MSIFVGLCELFVLVEIGVAGGRREHVRQQVVGVEILRIRFERLLAENDCFGVIVLLLVGLRLPARARRP